MKRIASGIITILFVFGLQIPALGFIDTQKHWARTTIDHLAARELVRGRTTSLFVPNAQVTRAEFIALLVNATGRVDDANTLQNGKSSFRDVKPGYWGKGSLEVAFEEGWLEPDASGRCYPDRILTRGEIARILVHALNLSAGAPGDIRDWIRIPASIQPSVRAVFSAGVMTGFPDGTFRAADKVTRAQAAILIEKVLSFRGDLYHAGGILKQLDMTARKAVIEVNGEEMRFPLAPNFVFSAGGAAANPPFSCSFDINRKGQLAYVLGTSESVKTVPLSTRAAAWPVAANNPAITVFQKPLQSNTLDSLVRDPAESARLNLSEIGIGGLQSSRQTDGTGIRVAILDTGVDPGHPDLQQTPDGKSKIVDWLDYTDDGRIDLSKTSIIDGSFEAERSQIVLPLASVSGQIWYGFLESSRLPVKLANNRKKILVVVLDQHRAGNYDTVLVDTDGDGGLLGETPLNRYNQAFQVANLVTENGTLFNFVVAGINTAEHWVKLGYDGFGHGSAIAGILAGNGQMRGVAPGVQIVSVKVSNGYGAEDLEGLKRAIRDLGLYRVQVANISLGYANLSARERADLEDLLNRVSRESGITFCVAGGNLGPATGTIATPASASNAVAVGGILTPDMWLLYYGWSVKKTTIYQFSSVGPNRLGNGPLLVAPASATSTGPMWKADYAFNEGTSIATPYVAGSAAILVQAAQTAGVPVGPDMIQQALALGAQPIDGYLPCEAGHGSLNLMRSLAIIRGQAIRPLQSSAEPKDISIQRQFTAAGDRLSIENSGSTARYVKINSKTEWIDTGAKTIQIPAFSSRTIPVKFDIINQPGLYSDYVSADDPATPGIDLLKSETNIVPYELRSSNPAGLITADRVPAGQYKRYFLRVPDGTGSLRLKVMPDQGADGRYYGRIRLFITNPKGETQASASYAGDGFPDTSSYRNFEENISNPQSGVWEIVVYSSVSITRNGLSTSNYRLEAALENWVDNQPAPASSHYWVSSGQPLDGLNGSELTLHIWNKGSNMPADSMILVNGRLYSVRNGTIMVPYDRTGYVVSW